MCSNKRIKYADKQYMQAEGRLKPMVGPSVCVRVCVCTTAPCCAGARSTAGREGPVVGRPVRHSGSRPLLLNEILEHWADEIKPTCLLRWSRQAGCSCSQLEHQAMEAFEQVGVCQGTPQVGVGQGDGKWWIGTQRTGQSSSQIRDTTLFSS